MSNDYHKVVLTKPIYFETLLFPWLPSPNLTSHSLSLSLGMWQAVSEKLQVLKKSLDEGDQGALGEIRKTLLGLVAPVELVCHIAVFVRT